MAPPLCGTANASVDNVEETAVLQKYPYMKQGTVLAKGGNNHVEH